MIYPTNPSSDTIIIDPENSETPKSAVSAKSFAGAPLALIVTLLITLGLFLPILNYTFAPVDDASNVLTNPYIDNLSHQNLGYFFLHPFYFVYMPLTFILWGLCARIAPLSTPQQMPLTQAVTTLNPTVFHAASLLLHLANTALVFALLRRFKFLPWACAAGALVFALHPAQVESVAWVTGTNNLTAGFFSFLALYLYVLAVPQDSAPGQSAPGNRILFALATAAFVCALLSKPSAAALPFSVAVLEMLVYRRPWRRWLALMLLWCVLAVFCILFAQSASTADSSTVWSPLWGRPFIAGDALAFYVVRLAAPVFTLDYARPPVIVLRHWWGFVDWLLPVIVLGVLWFWPLPRRSAASANSDSPKSSWPRAAALLFVCGLVTTLGLVPFYFQWDSTVADRYLYSAMLGPSVLAAYVLSRLTLPVNGRIVAGAVGVIVLGSLTALQVPVWRNPFTFVEYTVTTEPDAPFVHSLAGDVLYYRGDFAQALLEFESVDKLWGIETVLNNRKILNSLIHLERFDEALRPLMDNVAAAPDDKTAWLQLWSLLPRVHDSTRLEAMMRQRIGRNPHDGKSAFTIGVILLDRGLPADALPYLRAGALDAPDFAEIQFRYGAMLEGTGRLLEAETQYQRALALDPSNQPAATALAALRHRIGLPAQP